ncbi:MAG: T9SS C-terminal target domain-containing protein [Calditrichaeota bacterium]|nr:MAG: T9SS C-terminal target domain-containing protein [Calditrichota bacterium]
MKFAKFQTIGLSLLLSSIPLLANAGNISEDLQQQISELREGERVSAYVHLKEQVDIKPFKSRFNQERLKNSERRDILLPILKEVANRTQKNILDYLKASPEKVESFESNFLSNMIFITNATPELLEEIASFEEVQTLFRFYERTIPTPVSPEFQEKGSSAQISQKNAALSAINADKLWALGYDGSGVIVMNIDSGVDGNQPYLSSSWYGLQPNVQWNHAWNDAAGQNSQFPEDLPSNTHGTGTMSMMVGHTLTDTLGTAPGAWWIGSKHNAGVGITIGNPGAGFSWASQLPADVLDKLAVVNNSYGGNTGGCANLSEFQTYNTFEALGVATVWSAGNEGPGAQTQGDVASGAISSVNTFSVGSVNSNQVSVSGFSSRGPSGCANSPIVPPPHNADFKIKPEVMAQGSLIKVANGSAGGGGTSNSFGTSFSGPVVAGAIALLKNVNPNVTAEEAKLALLTTAKDLGAPGDDNDYGMGIIDVLAAAGEISPLVVSGSLTNSSNGNPISFATVKVIETEQEFITAANGNYTAKPLLTNISLEVSAFGYQTATFSGIPTLTPNNPVDFPITLVQNPGATVSGTFDDGNGNAIVGEIVVYGITGNEEFEFTSFQTDANGDYSVDLPESDYRMTFIPGFPYSEMEIPQFSINAGQNMTFDYSNGPASLLIVGADQSSSVDTIYKKIGNDLSYDSFLWDLDENPNEPTLAELGMLTQPSIVVWYTGSKTFNVMSVSQEQLLVDYLNAGGHLVLSGQNIIQTQSNGALMTMLGLGNGGNYQGSSDFVRGISGSALSAPGATLGFLMRASGANPENIQDSKDVINVTGNGIVVAGYGASATEGNAVVTVQGNNWKAAVFGFDLASIIKSSPALTSSDEALQAIVDDLFVVGIEEKGKSVPNSFSLEQNFPNPFNPSTKISFNLPKTTNVKLEVFNVKGQLVKTLANGSFESGKQSISWNATDEIGNLVSTGIYFYKLTTPEFSSTKKAVFLK